MTKTSRSAGGKPAVTAHAAVHGLNVPTKDSIVEVKIRFDGATMIDVEFDDRAYTARTTATSAGPRCVSQA